MRSANVYAGVMRRGDALRRAWQNSRARNGVRAVRLRPDEMRPGDRVAISVGALWGEMRWYAFAQIVRARGETETVAAFDVGPDWPKIQFVLPRRERFVTERRPARRRKRQTPRKERRAHDRRPPSDRDQGRVGL